MKAKPENGKGERFLDCPHYESCLDFAAIQNWKFMTCESCPFFKSEVKEMPTKPQKKENTRICSECGVNHTIQPSSPLCASCIGKQAWKDGKAKKKQLPKKKIPPSPKKRDITQGKGKHKAEKVQQRGNMELTIRFGKYASLLTEIEKMAFDQVRPPDLQVIYILKSYLLNKKHSGAVK